MSGFKRRGATKDKAMAEDPHEFLRKRVREVVDRRETSGRSELSCVVSGRVLMFLSAVALGLVVGLAVLAFTAPASEAGRNLRGPLIKFHCSVAKTEAIDPILDPMHPHEHIFFGNRGVDADSTGESLAANQDTTCAKDYATSSWWIPVVRDQDGPLEVKNAVPYYGGRGEQKNVVDMPRGLQLIGSASTTEVKYGCGGHVRSTKAPTHCKAKEFLRIRIHFPDCWNGDHLGSSSVTFAGEEACPPEYPHQLPDSWLVVNFKNPDGIKGTLEVSAGAGEWLPAQDFMHADDFEANQEPEFSKQIDRCIRKVGDKQLTPKGCAS
jgi:hypothetical protein